MKKINPLRFNVYEIYEPAKDKSSFGLEYLQSEGGWSSEGLDPEYSSLNQIAKKIVELVGEDWGYKRVVSKEEPMDGRDGNLEGVLLGKSKITLVTKLCPGKLKELTREISKIKESAK